MSAQPSWLACSKIYALSKFHSFAARISLTLRSQELAFELDAFFEPHVHAWLRDTEDNTTHDWVSRAVGMDSVRFSTLADRSDVAQWVPEGQHRHSQSVIDLFDFIRESVRVVLQDLPLEEYKRACYLIDLSKVSPCPIYWTRANLRVRQLPAQSANTLLRCRLCSWLRWRQARLLRQLWSFKASWAAKLALGWPRASKLSRTWKRKRSKAS